MTTAATKTTRTINLLAASVIAFGALLAAAPASAEGFNARAFLFGSSVKMQEGRSAQVSAPVSVKQQAPSAAAQIRNQQVASR